MIKIVIAEDSPVTKHALTSFLNTKSEISIVGEASDVNQTLSLVKRLNPDILILDLYLEESFSATIIEQLLEINPLLNVIIFSQIVNLGLIYNLFKCGVKSYIRKGNTLNSLYDAVLASRREQYYVSSEVLTLLIMWITDREHDPKIELSMFEVIILFYVLDAKTVKAMSELLHITERCMGGHLSKLYKKLNISGIKELTLFAEEYMTVG